MTSEWTSLNERQWMDGTKQTDGDGRQIERQRTLNGMELSLDERELSSSRMALSSNKTRLSLDGTTLSSNITRLLLDRMKLLSDGSLMKNRRMFDEIPTDVDCDVRWTLIPLANDVMSKDVATSDCGGTVTRVL
jgi:hypothetical protein